jgi:tetratricopeptide (TPR) repeat protein
VLLIARPAGSWWPALAWQLREAGIELGQTMHLQSLARGPNERGRVFDSARDQFATMFGVASTVTSARPSLAGGGFGLVLTLHMAALVAVDAQVRGKRPPDDPVGLSVYLLDREYDYWQNLYDHDDQVTMPPPLMARTVYAATLAGPLLHDQAVAALDRVGIASAESADEVIREHIVCYPPTEIENALEPLYPDRLGEDFIALHTPGHQVVDYLPDEWARDAPRHLLGRDNEPAAPWTRPALAVLIEAAHRWPHLAERQLYPLLRDEAALALAAGGPALSRLTGIANVPIDVLEAIERNFPIHRDVNLDTGIASVTRVLTQHWLGRTTDPDQAAALHATLGTRLSYAGDHHEALAATDRAVKIYQELASENPDKFEPNLARVLANLGSRLASLGQREEALKATKQAISIGRRLGTANTDDFSAILASLLTNLGNDLADMGDREQALAVAEEAVSVYRQLAESDPIAVAPHLATSLNNLGNRLFDLGLRRQALDVMREAIDICRRLAAVNPAAYKPDLAMSLGNLGLEFAGLGQWDEALHAATETVSIYRRLAADNPAAVEPDLALSLANLGMIQSRLGQRDEALHAATEAVSIYRRLAADNPAAVEPDLALSLANASSELSSLQRHEEALDAAEEAAAIRRRLAAQNPTAFEPELAISLDRLGMSLTTLGRSEAGLDAVEEAVAILRRLAARNPATFEPRLAASLDNLGICRSGLGSPELAIEATTQAVEIRHRLAAAEPDAFDGDLATSLNNLALWLSDLGRHEEALSNIKQAVLIRRKLARSEHPGLRPQLARALWAYACVCAAGRLELPHALAAIEEAVAMYELFAANAPEVFATDLWSALHTLADVLDALDETDQADELRRQLGSSLF